MSDKQNQYYLNKAINYIIENFTKPPDLEAVAKISGFSKFHFHRQFKAFTGETLNQFIKRIRLERAAFMLVFQKHRTVTDIALSCGFSSSQNFATDFKKHFHMTPKLYKEYKVCQGILVHDPDTISIYNNIQVRFVDSFQIAYERTFCAYTDSNFHTIRKKFIEKYPNRQYIGLFWDDPTITANENCRYDYGYIITENNIEMPENLSTQTLEQRTYIALTTQFDNLDQINSVKVWHYLYTNWLPRHGYIADTLFCFESIYENEITFYLPIQKI